MGGGQGTLIFASPWQVHGAAEASLAAASATARAEVATACMAPERLAQEGPSLQLPEDVLQLARRLTAVAVQSLARCSVHPQKPTGLEVRGLILSASSAWESYAAAAESSLTNAR